MTSHTVHTQSLIAPTLINIAARGRPGASVNVEAAVVEESISVIADLSSANWQGSLAIAEVATLAATAELWHCIAFSTT